MEGPFPFYFSPAPARLGGLTAVNCKLLIFPRNRLFVLHFFPGHDTIDADQTGKETPYVL